MNKKKNIKHKSFLISQRPKEPQNSIFRESVTSKFPAPSPDEIKCDKREKKILKKKDSGGSLIYEKLFTVCFYYRVLMCDTGHTERE